MKNLFAFPNEKTVISTLHRSPSIIQRFPFSRSQNAITTDHSDPNQGRKGNTIFTRIIEPHPRALDLPLLIRSNTFLVFCLKLELKWLVFAMLSLPYPKEGILEVL